MATKKVGIYRNYYGPIPTDRSGRPLPKSEWPKKRAHSWVVRWHGSDGQRYSRSVPTRKEAEQFAEEKQAEVREGQGDPPEQMTLKQFGDMYLKIRTGLTPRSRDEHARTLKFLRQQLGAQLLVDQISPVDARRFIRWYTDRKVHDEPVSPATVNKVLRECQRIFREAVECRLIRVNPFYGIRQQKVAPAEWHCVTPDEYQRLLGACRSDRWRGIVALAYCCGLRLGEIINLTWADIDFSEAVLRVVAKRGRGGTEAWMPKDKDARTVPIPKSVLDLLTQLQVNAAAGQVYVFVVPSGSNAGHRMPRQNFWRDFDALRRRAGLPPGSLHALRKSYCTNLSGAVPLHVVQELAGHSDIRTTRRYYVKMQPEFIAAARAAVEAALEVQE